QRGDGYGGKHRFILPAAFRLLQFGAVPSCCSSLTDWHLIGKNLNLGTISPSPSPQGSPMTNPPRKMNRPRHMPMILKFMKCLMRRQSGYGPKSNRLLGDLLRRKFKLLTCFAV